MRHANDETQKFSIESDRRVERFLRDLHQTPEFRFPRILPDLRQKTK